ncbi:hypothetical protein HBI65_164830 [Parastagonospora nodorum]|nr:hypothetical protein HBI65_164830 [Parastagonospora nodorum]
MKLIAICAVLWARSSCPHSGRCFWCLGQTQNCKTCGGIFRVYFAAGATGCLRCSSGGVSLPDLRCRRKRWPSLTGCFIKLIVEKKSALKRIGKFYKVYNRRIVVWSSLARGFQLGQSRVMSMDTWVT